MHKLVNRYIKKFIRTKLFKKLFGLAHIFRKLYWRIFKVKTFGVRVMLVNEMNKVLLIQHHYNNLWVFPGGCIEKDENPNVAGAREIEEETGIVIFSFLGTLGTYKNTKEGRNDTVTVLVSSDFDLSQVNSEQNIEVCNMGWFDLDKLPEQVSVATRSRVLEYQEKIASGPMLGKPIIGEW